MHAIRFITESTKANVKKVSEVLERDSEGYFIRVAFTDGNSVATNVKCYVAADRLEEIKSIAGPPIYRLKGDPEDIIKEDTDGKGNGD